MVFVFSCSSAGGNGQGNNQGSSSSEQSSSSAIICEGIEYAPYSHYCSYDGKLIAKEEFPDERDGKIYKYVSIYNQIWMAENLNYDAAGGRCYDGDYTNCEKYGRLYTRSETQEACPPDWRLPSDNEWGALMVDGINMLAISDDWEENFEKKDYYGFSILPGGHGQYSENIVKPGWNYYDIGKRSEFWGVDDSGTYGEAYISPYYMNYSSFTSGFPDDMIGVRYIRCVRY